MLNPSSINRTSVKLASGVFHESTCKALQYYASICEEKKDWAETSKFVELILRLWSIINVKSSSVRLRKRDSLRLPITSVDDERLELLEKYEHLLQTWKETIGRQKLSNETLSALILMCQTLRSVTVKLLNDGF